MACSAISSTGSQMRDRRFVLCQTFWAAVLALVQLSITLACGGEAGSASRDYTQWRGRHGDGSASAFIEPDRWPEELKLKWKVAIGEG